MRRFQSRYKCVLGYYQGTIRNRTSLVCVARFSAAGHVPSRTFACSHIRTSSSFRFAGRRCIGVEFWQGEYYSHGRSGR